MPCRVIGFADPFETGELDLRSSTGLGSLMVIGAMVRTAGHERGNLVIQTDIKGLDMLERDTDCALTAIFASLEALGRLLAGIDARWRPRSERRSRTYSTRLRTRSSPC